MLCLCVLKSLTDHNQQEERDFQPHHPGQDIDRDHPSRQFGGHADIISLDQLTEGLRCLRIPPLQNQPAVSLTNLTKCLRKWLFLLQSPYF